jgi:hypothetical protein
VWDSTATPQSITSFSGAKAATRPASSGVPAGAPFTPPSRNGSDGFAILPTPPGSGSFLFDLFAALLAALTLAAPQLAKLVRMGPRASTAAALRLLIDRPG